MSLIMMLPVITAGSLLPTWMFINALQIIAHTTLLNTLMPANAHYFLKKYMDWLRWYDQDFMKWLNETVELKRYRMTDGAYHALLNACDYDHLLAKNMVLIFCVFSIILLVWLICTIKDKFTSQTSKHPCCRRKHGKWCQNFSLRFVYEFFLEFCICIVLQLSVKDFSDFSPSMQFGASITIAIATIALIAFVVSLLFYRGPWVSGFFLKGTSAYSIAEKRPLNPEFDAKKHIRDNPV